MTPEDPQARADRIRRTLRERGWAHVRDRLSEAEFEATARGLGAIDLRTVIVVDPERRDREKAARRYDPDRPSVYHEAELEFHTDRPTADLLAWYCVTPDADDGSNLLIDTRDFFDRLSAPELRALGRIRVGYANLDPSAGGQALLSEPLVTGGADGWRVFYVPWQVLPSDDEEANRLLARFADDVAARRARGPLRIRLEAGESLFIDNHRMLHGRGPLSPDSRRHLVRLYIRTADRIAPAAP
jgi:alpha-ketoglutarate-dependent taurine dioxygenase